MNYFTSKGLFVRNISKDRYVVEDIFGTCSMPFETPEDKLDETLKNNWNLEKLVTLGVINKFPDLSDFQWQDLEYYYIAHIDYSFLNSILAPKEKERFHSLMGLFPLAYSECGHGEGSKDIFETIHNQFKEACSNEGSPLNENDLTVFLVKSQISRICSDIMSLLNRAITGYSNLLVAQRDCINESHTALHQLNVSEIVHSGQNSYRVATEITSLVISLCSSLDLSAKLIQYINSIKPEKLSFKGARDKQHHEVRKISSIYFSSEFIQDITTLQSSAVDLPELIQFRNDLIHSTSAIELEKIFVGIGHKEINDLPLYYSAQYSRDCLDNGQPHRYLGRDYFSSTQLDIEVKALSWVNSVISYHLEVGKKIHEHLKSVKKT